MLRKKVMNTGRTISMKSLLSNKNPLIENTTKELIRMIDSLKKPTTRSRIINAIEDQSTLKMITLRSEHSELRVMAVMKMTDQTLLAEIAEKTDSEEVAEIAINKIKAIDLLVGVLESSTVKNIREIAVERIVKIRDNDNDSIIKMTSLLWPGKR